MRKLADLLADLDATAVAERSPDVGITANQLSREDAVRLMRGGLADAMRDIAARYVIPICWITARDGEPLILDNGSAFLLDCGTGPFMITANHVYQGFCAAKAKYPNTVCILGDIRFDPTVRCIASDPAYDVATFRVTPDERGKLAKYANGKLVLTGNQASWPPQPPQLDRGVFFVGFPGDGRTMRPYRGNSVVEVDWTGYTALAVASGVSHTDVTLVFDHERDFAWGIDRIFRATGH